MRSAAPEMCTQNFSSIFGIGQLPARGPVLLVRCNLQGRSRILAIQGRTIVLARLLRRTERMAPLAPQPVPPTAAPNDYPDPLSFSDVPNKPSAGPRTVARKRRRNRVRVEGLYLEREPEPKLHAQALLRLIQDECPEKVGSFIPRSHLERAYRELCDYEGWKALNWVAVARALGKLTCKRLLKRNGVRFVAYRLSAPLTKSRLALDCPGIAPSGGAARRRVGSTSCVSNRCCPMRTGSVTRASMPG